MNMDFAPFMHHTKAVNTQLGSVRGRHPATAHEKLVDQTRKWVATTFFAPMLKQMRQSPFHSPLLDGGRGGEAFGSLYDQELAGRMTRGTSNKLVNSIVNRIEGRKAYARQAHAKTLMQKRQGDHARAALYHSGGLIHSEGKHVASAL
jgi:Rod binding domain-containing protein